MVKANEQPLVINSVLLIANTGLGSFFGFLFWTLAAQNYTSVQVGLGAAYISTLTFLVTFAEMGLGTVSIKFAPSLGAKQVSFVNSILVVGAISTLVVSTIFVVGIPVWAPDLDEIGESSLYLCLFLGSAVAFSSAQLLDRIFIAFQATHFTFVRNLIANMIRIGIILTIGLLFGAIGLLLAVGIAALITLSISITVFIPRILPDYRMFPLFTGSVIQDKVSYALANHFSQLLWRIPPLIYPLVIITLLGAEANAHFYINWMLANILFIVPTSIATSVFARTSNKHDTDEKTFWRIMKLTLIGLVPIVIVFAALSRFLLSIFGQEYVTNYRLLILFLASVFPYTTNTFIIIKHRIRQNNFSIMCHSGIIAILSLMLIVVLGRVYGLLGVGIGWLSGQLIGVLVAVLQNRYSAYPVILNDSSSYKEVNQMKDKNILNKGAAILVFPFAAPNVLNFANKLATTVAPLTTPTVFVGGKIPPNLSWPDQVQIVDIGVRLHYLSQKRPRWLSAIVWVAMVIVAQILLAWQVVRLRRKIDVVICFMGVYYQLPLLLAKLLKKKVLVTSWGISAQSAKMNYDNSVTALVDSLARINFTFSDGILVDSLRLGTHQELVPFHTKLHNGALFLENPDQFQIHTPIQVRKNLVGFIGRLVVEKGVQEFVQAIPLILEHEPDLHFQIIGTGRLDKELEQALRNQPWADRVSWLRWIEHDDMPRYLNQLKLLVVPSLMEGLPNLLLEAMGCGTPVLATGVDGIPDLIIEERTGFLLKNNSPEAIVQGTIKAINYPHLETITKQARKLIEQNYSLEAAGKRYQTILTTIYQATNYKNESPILKHKRM